MGGDGSAYSALGLEPGADRAAVERAYRALIKHHHPDREGGDSARAAEINRAYRELRDWRLAPDGIEFHEVAEQAPRVRFGIAWLAMALALAAASLGLLIMAARDTPLFEHGLSSVARASVAERRAEPMREPIVLAAVEGGLRDAVRIGRSGDEMALSSASRACHDRLRAEPSLALLDRCAAFDDAVVILQDRDPLRDRGQFSELAVTSRQWSAAKTLSDDFVAIDSRLDQVRLRVDRTLAGLAADAN